MGVTGQVQFHPEAAGGPTDTAFLFHYFLNAVKSPNTAPVTTIPFQLPRPFKKVPRPRGADSTGFDRTIDVSTT